MEFGRNANTPADSETQEDTYISETQANYIIDVDDEVQQTQQRSTTTEGKDASRPLLKEVTFNGAGNNKNYGGSKQWVCNHCKGKFTSLYTRIHVHFLDLL